MKVIELLKICEIPMKGMLEMCIKLEDCHYISLYDEFAEMKKFYKVSYCVAVLAEKYRISERKVYKLLKKFGMEYSL